MCHGFRDRSGSIAIAIAETLSSFGGVTYVDDIAVAGGTHATRLGRTPPRVAPTVTRPVKDDGPPLQRAP